MSADAYRRHARRLRGRHAGRPGELHRALRDLAHERDRHRAREAGRDRDPTIDKTPDCPQAVTVSRRIRPDASTSQGVAERFIAEVESKLSAGLLSYSDRLALLRRARRLGLDRFNANLLIATAQHARRAPVPSPTAPRVTRGRGKLLPLVAFVLLEAAIGALAWLTLAR
jgi:hypothetical protein